ncbi:hypothetical protein RHSIM_Rhsim10G0134300 [Rhododendron simsii]|uniref:Uncharacterized protein n=1 Tax=Rhododendron simsii TaxID=118357 RepID=A0A834GBC5_RHOSS|nr:hypothetical protein RHSIM_Rhsim10G0134300 [Rhododendron simsii]
MFKSSAYLMDAYVFFNKWQTTSKNAYLLVGDDIKWIFGSSNQLHFNVVSSSNRGHYIQVCHCTGLVGCSPPRDNNGDATKVDEAADLLCDLPSQSSARGGDMLPIADENDTALFTPFKIDTAPTAPPNPNRTLDDARKIILPFTQPQLLDILQPTLLPHPAVRSLADADLAKAMPSMASLVGSLNKIPLSVAGIFLFNVPTSLENSASILFGLVAGVFFARAKMREKSQS